MSSGVVCTNMGIKPGQRFGVKGDIAPGAKSFVLNLGKDANNLALHFNPRFDAHGDVRTIVCNSKKGEEWGAEHRESQFPFQEGSSVEVFFTHNKDAVTVTLPGNHHFKVPNALALPSIDYMAAEGDFKIKSVNFE
uniref:Galectin n=1 Tax=Sphenodon punctatus TaxID=8508 RepID=A0A8D0H0T9_SPHPU